ncbi:hypothetical protein F2Q70_00017545 [Brassica cretica]|uniref:Uncharacterized protein n=1 Tax=Brassica cretica TaxID=69181 RepID=A0A8S9I274_BRACR|nr:hypothetical protein F2Q70_00017545 [Brassica cretica]
MDFRPGTRRLDGLSSRNPEAGWTFVLEPGGRMDFRLGTRRQVFWSSAFLYQNLGASSNASSNYPWEDIQTEPDVNPEMLLGSEGRFWSLETALDPEDPETAWGGTVLRLPRQDYSRYLFGFRILPLGSWPLSSSYVVFYFCRKSLTGLEGAGVGVMTQVQGSAAFHVWRSRVLIAPWIDAGVRAGASLNRNLEAGVLPEAWMTFPNQFAPYFSISSSNSGNNLCTEVNRSCSFSADFPWAGHLSSNPSFPGPWSHSIGCQDLFMGLVACSSSLWSGLCLKLEGSRFPRDRHGSNGYSQACVWFRLIDLGRFRLLASHVDWTARLIGLAGEDHLYLLKSAVGDLLPRSETGILDLGFALQ